MPNTLRRATKGFSNSRWDEPIRADLFQIPSKPVRVRMYDNIAIVRQHWVEFYSEKKKGQTGFFELCLNWNPAAEENNEVDGRCPLCEQGIKFSEYFYGYLFSRSGAQKRMLKVQPVRLTGKTASDISKLSEIVYPDVPEDEAPLATDTKKGFDFFIRQENVNKKVTYFVNVTQDPPAPLTKEERAAFEDYLNTGHDIAQLAKPNSRSQVVESMRRLKLVEGGAAQPSGGGLRKRPAATEDYDQVPADDEDERPATKAPPRERRASVSGPPDDDEDEAPRPAAAARPWDDVDEDQRVYASADEEDAPDADEEE